VMVNAIETSIFERLLAGMAVPPAWSLVLLDSVGGTIAQRAPAGGVAAASAQRRFSASTTLAPWSVALDIPRASHLAPLATASMVMLLAVVGTTLVALLGGHWASRRLARSVEALADTARGASAPVGDIVEIAAARRRLDDAARERQRAEAELQRSTLALQVREAQLRGILDSASDAIVAADQTQTVVMANPAAARLFACRVDELLGAPVERLIPERYRAGHRELVRAFGEGEVTSRSMTVGRGLTALRSTGEEFPIEAAISHVHIDGQRLYTVILRDITERRRAEQELRSSKTALEISHADLQRLIAAQDSVQEFERKRMARELHDDLQQTLAAIMMDVSAIRGEPAIDRSRLGAMLSRIESLAGAAIASTRRIVNDLRPQMLEELGLAAALDSLAAQFGERTGIACDFEADERALALESQASPTATCLFRVAQESLNNVAKHAQARHVVMRLAVDHADRLTLTIRDDGKGLAAEDRRKARSFGLMGMAERVRAVGGMLRVDSRPGAGTVVEVQVPVAVPVNA
jgi:PAS domain S-box-containing protein